MLMLLVDDYILFIECLDVFIDPLLVLNDLPLRRLTLLAYPYVFISLCLVAMIDVMHGGHRVEQLCSATTALSLLSFRRCLT